MTTVRSSYDELFSLSWRLRGLIVTLRHARDTIRSESFEVELWNAQKDSEFMPMVRSLQRYMRTRCAKEIIVTMIDTFLFYWQHVIDAFARETPEWRITHIEFIQERIEHARWIDGTIREEMRSLEERMRQYP